MEVERHDLHGLPLSKTSTITNTDVFMAHSWINITTYPMACQVSHSFCHVKSNTQLHICRQATTYSSTFTLVVFIFASIFFQELYQATIFRDLQDSKEVAYVSKEGKTRRMYTQAAICIYVFIYLFIFKGVVIKRHKND